jgi:transposase-like protein
MSERTVLSCPECSSSRSVYHRVTHGDYRCHECGATFEEPDRERKEAAPPLTGTARRLWEMDAEEAP